MKFNINDYVKVRLTDAGKQHLEDEHNKFYDRFFPWREPPEYVPPVEDEDGWSKWQLWVLIDRIGRCSFDGQGPIETDIEICEEPKQ